MKNLLIVIAILFLSNNSFAQSWETYYPNIPRTYYLNTSILDNGNIVISGGGGYILKSTDDGDTWKTLHHDYNMQKLEMNCVNNDTWFFFGRDSSSGIKFFKTTDAGNSFEYINNINGQLPYFINENTGWVKKIESENTYITKTTDGGLSWNTISQFGINFNVNYICFKNELQGFLAVQKPLPNNNILLRTLNGGISWDTLNIPFSSGFTTRIETFNNTLYANSDGSIYKSIDNGENWIPVSPEIPIKEFNFKDEQNGIAVSTGEPFSVFKTVNGGLSWSRNIIEHLYNSEYSGSISYRQNKIFVNALEGFYCYSKDDGNSYETNNQFRGQIREIKFFDEKNGVLITDSIFSSNYVYETSNGGNSWNISNRFLNGKNIKNIHKFGQNEFIILKADSIYKSYDGGLNWTGYKLPVLNGSYSYNDLNFIDGGTGILTASFACSQVCSVKFFRTLDKGNTFNEINIPLQYFYNSNYQFINSYTGYAVNNFGRFVKTIDGGNNWSETTSIGNPSPYKFFVFNDESVIMINGHGIQRSTDFINWQIVNNFTSSLFNHLSVIDQSNIFVLRSGNFQAQLFKSTDKGVSWNSEFFDHLPDWNTKFEFLNSQTGFLYNRAYILKTTNGGMTTSISNSFTEVPSDFLLHQNYPNPFNPVTNIKFSIPKNSFVSLKVFDITGKEVSTLVNENLSVGVYEYRFDADEFNLSSGVYFYRMSAGEFLESKKLLLIK